MSRLVVLTLASVATTALLASIGCREGGSTPAVTEGAATFVGGASCAECHPGEHARWLDSHHDLAMQPADASTVLGDFDDAAHEHFGLRSSFRREGDAFVVRTDGPDGVLADFEVAWVFGVEPLQQYLVAFPDGRVQCLPLAWDSRPAEEGGQRWFHLYPDERLPHGDALHWTGPNQTWNFMCAECHSTDLRKEYRLEQDRYETSWAELDVACEACHGPGSVHVERARAEELGAGSGLLAGLVDHDEALWRFDPETGIARRDPPRSSGVQVETCARCHARRSVISEDYVPGRPLLDTHRTALLSPGLYHADGQILEEVYVYGSFLQSAMHREGVSCSDCHDPHSLEIPAPLDTVCARCHLPERFATPTHHHHAPDSPGASCVECHMPETTYMVVDPRRDHSLRVPRPDVAVRIGAPDACSACHADLERAEVVRTFVEWYPERATRPHWGETLAAGREGRPGAAAALSGLARDAQVPGIVRATALELLRDLQQLDPSLLAATLADPEPLVRRGALDLLTLAPAEVARALAPRLLGDPVRAVRIEAGRLLAAVPAAELSERDREARDAALEEYVAAQLANADRAGSHLNLGTLHLELGDPDAAEADYLRAIELEPTFGPTYVNLADLYRLRGRDAEGEALLLRGIERAPHDAALPHALGLLLVRLGRKEEAVEQLARACELDPGNPSYPYVYAAGLLETGERQRAIETLRSARGRHPNDVPVLAFLVQLLREDGAQGEALDVARHLARLLPGDASIAELVEELEGR